MYYARIFVPKDLQSDMGKKEIRPSLHTADHKEAKRRLTALMDQWVATFDDMRRRRELNDADIAAAVWDHYSAALEAGDNERASRPTKADVDAAIDHALAEARRSGAANAGPIAMINAMADVEILANKSAWAARRRAARLKRLKLDLGTGDTRLIEPDADAFLAKHGFKIERGGVRYREFCHRLMRADIEQLERYAERDQGNFTGKPKDPTIVEPENAPDPIGLGGESVMGLFDKYEKENPNNISAATLVQSRRDVGHFSEFVGPHVRVSKLNKKMVREWKDVLADWPVKASDTNAFQGKSIREIIALNKASKNPKPGITRNTIRRYMGSLSGYCTWLENNDYIASNPVSGLMPKKGEPANKRASFTDAQLKKLFTSPLFTSCEGDEWPRVDEPGSVKVRDHRYWIPLVMAYSGARPAEIAQLHVGDVREQHGIWTMHITTEGEGGKRVKTKGSMRVVPIHSELIRLGFVKHCQKTTQTGKAQIFPEVEIPKTGQIAAQFSREFNRYMARVGVKTGSAIVTYSLRHTFIDRARLAGFMNEEIGLVVGHGAATMTGRYGVEQEGTLKRRAEIIEAVTYGLD